MKALLAVPLLALSLSACGETETASDPKIEVRGEMQDGLFDLSPVNRDIALKRAIRGLQGQCDRVDYSGYVGKYESADMWTARCDGNIDWAIFISGDDSAQIRYCKDVEASGLPACEIARLNSEGENTPEVSPVTPGSNEP